jgi:hypothetical protein
MWSSKSTTKPVDSDERLRLMLPFRKKESQGSMQFESLGSTKFDYVLDMCEQLVDLCLGMDGRAKLNKHEPQENSAGGKDEKTTPTPPYLPLLLLMM